MAEAEQSSRAKVNKTEEWLFRRGCVDNRLEDGGLKTDRGSLGEVPLLGSWATQYHERTEPDIGNENAMQEGKEYAVGNPNQGVIGEK